ncbi:hypothetical protein FBU31_000377 [Coemansia sp. 'formosensis']|nr:hypothetical protein FBU31_000377 [Coemansia sp. 'formosensis']
MGLSTEQQQQRQQQQKQENRRLKKERQRLRKQKDQEKLEKKRQERQQNEEWHQLYLKEQLEERRERLRLEQAKNLQLLTLSHRPSPVGPRSPNDVLQLVFSYLSPAPRPDCRGQEVLGHLRSLQRVAAVNQQWRAVALPAFYHTAIVVIGDSLDHEEADDSNDSDDDDHVNTSTTHLHEYHDESDGNGSYFDNDHASDGYEFYYDDDSESDDDECLINMFGPSCGGTSVDIKLRTNIWLLRTAGQTGNAREVQIIVQGKSQTAGQLKRQLQLAGLGRETAWSGVERLRIDMRDCSSITQTDVRVERGPRALHALNDFLSQAMPSLREIEYYGYNSKRLYDGIPIERLIKERLHGPTPLRVLRIKADCQPRITDYKLRAPAHPVSIACMEIECPDKPSVMPVPFMMADTLVELRLDPVILKNVWWPFVVKSHCESPMPDLSFSSLRSLSLGVLNTKDKHLGWSNRTYEGEGLEYEGYGGGMIDYDTVYCTMQTQFQNLRTCNSTLFPVLTALDVRHPQGNIKGSLRRFAASPISSLKLCCSMANFNDNWDLADFYRLHSLSIRIMTAMGTYDAHYGDDGNYATDASETLSAVFATTNPSLQNLTLSMNLSTGSRLLLTTPPSFANTLDSLTLDGEFGQSDIEHLLQLFPNIRYLSVCVICCEPIFSSAELVDRYRLKSPKQLLKPFSSSLRILNAYGKRNFANFTGLDCTAKFMRLLAPELNHYRGLLIDLVLGLPALDTLRTSTLSLVGVKESIRALIETDVGQDYLGHLQRLRVQSLDNYANISLGDQS